MVYSALEFQMKRDQKVMHNEILKYNQKGNGIQRRLEKFLKFANISDIANVAFCIGAFVTESKFTLLAS